MEDMLLLMKRFANLYLLATFVSSLTTVVTAVLLMAS